MTVCKILKMKNNTKTQMPLSPHLGIYKWQINMALSICHRMSGVFLYIFLMKIIWLFALNVIFPESEMITFFNELLITSKFGKSILSLIGVCFYYHLFNGIRHMFWDIGHGFEIKTMQFTSILVLFCTLILSGITGALLFFG